MESSAPISQRIATNRFSRMQILSTCTANAATSKPWALDGVSIDAWPNGSLEQSSRSSSVRLSSLFTILSVHILMKRTFHSHAFPKATQSQAGSAIGSGKVLRSGEGCWYHGAPGDILTELDWHDLRYRALASHISHAPVRS